MRRGPKCAVPYSRERCTAHAVPWTHRRQAQQRERERRHRSVEVVHRRRKQPADEAEHERDARRRRTHARREDLQQRRSSQHAARTGNMHHSSDHKIAHCMLRANWKTCINQTNKSVQRRLCSKRSAATGRGGAGQFGRGLTGKQTHGLSRILEGTTRYFRVLEGARQRCGTDDGRASHARAHWKGDRPQRPAHT